MSAILRGRPVLSYNVLARIAEGLGIPRGWMGLAFRSTPVEDDTAYPVTRAVTQSGRWTRT